MQPTVHDNMMENARITTCSYDKLWQKL